MERRAKYTINARLVIGGFVVAGDGGGAAPIDPVEFPISRVTTDWELNTIPRAVCLVAMGRNASDGLTPSPMHSFLAGQFIETLPARIYATVQLDDVSDADISTLGIPDGEFLLFAGQVAAISPTFGVEAYATITLTHWLSILDEGSAFSRSSHPDNPADYTFGTLCTNEQAGLLAYTPLALPSRIITSSTLSRDLWGKALLPWFDDIARRDTIAVRERGVTVRETNTRVRAALALLDSASEYGLPLSLRTAVDIDAADAIRDYIGRICNEHASTLKQSFWDIITGLMAPSFMFSVVPRISDALIAPIAIGYRGPASDTKAPAGKTLYLPTIRAGEYDAGSPSVDNRRPLRAVGVLTAIGTDSGVDLKEDRGGNLGAGGWYDTKKDGIIQIVRGLPWMSSIVAPDRAMADTSGIRGPIATGVAPRAADKRSKGKNAASNRAARDARQKTVLKPMLNAYAKWLFARDVVSRRQFPLSGPFRLDISPGSLVAVEGGVEAHIGASDALGGVYYGVAARVSLSLDADTGSAGMGIHLIATRSYGENFSDNVTIDEHPFYKDTFSAAPLYDAAAEARFLGLS